MHFQPAEAMDLLRRTPAVLRELLRNLPEPWLCAAEGPETWCAREVVAHLTELEESDWLSRVRIILRHGESRPFNPVDRVAFQLRFPTESVEELLDLFAERRTENLRALEELGLTPDQLSRTGTHPALGRVTLAQLLAAWTAHDLGHIGQVVRVMAKHYREDVGPWAEYLPVVSRAWGEAQ